MTEKDRYSRADMLAAMEKYHPEPVLMQKIRDAEFMFATYADVWMKKFNHENVVVIGDAAHGMSPQLGQGANMALVDSYFLDQVLAGGGPLTAALDKYSATRRSHIDFYTQASKLLTPLFQSDGRVYGLLRDYGFMYAQRLKLTRFLSSHILCGKRVSWWRAKELDYDGGP